MVDSTLASFMVNIKVLQVVVEIHRASTQVSTEQSCVSSEDGSNINLPLAASACAESWGKVRGNPGTKGNPKKLTAERQDQLAIRGNGQ